MYFNFDIGNNRTARAASSTFWGRATAARIRFTRNFALAPRLEYYSDRDGFCTGSPMLSANSRRGPSPG